MNGILLLLGAILGVLLLGKWHGLLIGALFAWLGGAYLALVKRVDALEARLADRSAEPVPPTPAPVRPAAPPVRDEPCFTSAAAPPPRPVPRPVSRPTPCREPLPAASRRALPEPLQWLCSGENLLVKAGVVILFFGVAFLVKYAAQRGLLPVQLRLAGAGLGGMTLLFLGWRLRHKRREYALTLQGGGIGILYITVYAACRICGLLAPLPTLVLLSAITVLAALLAVGENALTLALFAVGGGFCAPLLAPANNGPTLLFGYYLILNLGIAVIAWHRSWRLLNLGGFLATFVIGLWWGGRFYRPGYFGTVEPFLVAFFLLYVAIAVLFAWRQPPGLRGAVDGTLVFGTPIVAFALQAALVADHRYGLAWSALTAGLFYLALAGGLRRMLPELATAFAVFGALFITLAVPLACDGRWTSASWAVEGAAILWVELRQGRNLAAGFGIVLQFAAGIAFLLALADHPAASALLNADWLGTLLLAGAALVSAWRLRQGMSGISRMGLDSLLTVWGLLWWYGGGLRELLRFAPQPALPLLVILLLTATAAACHLLGRALDWDDLALPGLLLLPALLLAACLTDAPHPLANGGWWGWPLGLATVWLILYRDAERLSVATRTALHAGTLWLLAALVSWEFLWQVQQRIGAAGSWRELAALAAPLALLALSSRLSRGQSWPFARERVACLGVAALPMALWIELWVVVSTVNPADAWPFSWLPLLNPLDLGVLLSLIALGYWWRQVQMCDELAAIAAPLRLPARALGAATLFLWLNAILARSLSHWWHLPYAFHPLFHSSFVQTAFSLFWSLLALGAMFTAVRRQLRLLWLAGAGLLVGVVAKLFLVDLAGHGSIERIVSFVAVGLLLLVIGWFAPVPPVRERTRENLDASQADS